MIWISNYSCLYKNTISKLLMWKSTWNISHFGSYFILKIVLNFILVLSFPSYYYVRSSIYSCLVVLYYIDHINCYLSLFQSLILQRYFRMCFDSFNKTSVWYMWLTPPSRKNWTGNWTRESTASRFIDPTAVELW